MNDGDDSARTRFIRAYFDEVARVVREISVEQVAAVIGVLEVALEKGARVFVVGNGGSAATASHMANDLLKGISRGRGSGFRVVALTDNVPLLTAISNDVGYDSVFSAQLEVLAGPGDILVAISASGNSPNILRALDMARSKGMTVIGLAGMGGGKLAGLADHAVVVPSDDYGPVEDAHLVLDHLITRYFQELGNGSRLRAARI